MQIPSLAAVSLVVAGTIQFVLADRVVSPVVDHVMCPVVGSVSTNVVVDTSDNFEEISGLAVSPTQLSLKGNPIFFAQNDGGDGPRLGIFDSETGEHLLSLNVKGAINQDWEDITLGPCGDSDNTCIYIADTGDNVARTSGGLQSSRRDNPYRIYKIKEPMWLDHNSADEIDLDGELVFEYASFPLGEFADSEALFVDPSGWGDGASPGDLYVVTKWDSDLSQTHNRVFYIPISAWTLNGVYSPLALGPWSGDSVLMQNTFRSAEMSPDGTLLALGTSSGTHLFLRCHGASIGSVLKQTDSCLFWHKTPNTKLETVTWMPDGSRTLQIPEGDGVSMVLTTMLYDENLSQQFFPVVQYDEQGICRSVPGNDIYPDSWCDAAMILDENQGSPPSTSSAPSVAPSILTIFKTNRPSSPPASDATDQPTGFRETDSPTNGTQQTNEPTAEAVHTDAPGSIPTNQPTGFRETDSPTNGKQETHVPTVASTILNSVGQESSQGWLSRPGPVLSPIAVFIAMVLCDLGC